MTIDLNELERQAQEAKYKNDHPHDPNDPSYAPFMCSPEEALEMIDLARKGQASQAPTETYCDVHKDDAKRAEAYERALRKIAMQTKPGSNPEVIAREALEAAKA